MGEDMTLDLAAVIRDSCMPIRDGLVEGTPGQNDLVYEVYFCQPGCQHLPEFNYVDAHNGAVVEHITGIYHAASITKCPKPILGNDGWDEQL